MAAFLKLHGGYIRPSRICQSRSLRWSRAGLCSVYPFSPLGQIDARWTVFYMTRSGICPISWIISLNRARSLARKGEGTLSIGVLEGQDVNQVLSDRLSQIKTIYPQLQITLERNSYQNLRSGLRSGHYDLIITLSFDVEDEADFRLFTLYEKSPAIAMHKAHPLASQKR